jgi:hypothetical protein
MRRVIVGAMDSMVCVMQAPGGPTDGPTKCLGGASGSFSPVGASQ